MTGNGNNTPPPAPPSARWQNLFAGLSNRKLPPGKIRRDCADTLAIANARPPLHTADDFAHIKTLNKAALDNNTGTKKLKANYDRDISRTKSRIARLRLRRKIRRRLGWIILFFMFLPILITLIISPATILEPMIRGLVWLLSFLPESPASTQPGATPTTPTGASG